MVPARMRSAMVSARVSEPVHTPAASPNCTSLAIRTASSSLSKRITARTGPNTSSCAMRIRLSTPTKMVGSKNRPFGHPGTDLVWPPATRRAPSAFAISTYALIFSSWGSVEIGAICVAGSEGWPKRASLMNASRRATNSSWIEPCTRSRDPATHDCPDAAKMPATTPFTAWSRSASSNTMLGDLPPSSIVTRFMWRAAFSLMMRPASGPPVKAMRSTRGWLITASPTSGPQPVTTLRTRGGGDQRAAPFRGVAGHDVDDARREARGFHELDELQQRCRRELRWLQHDGVARRQRRRELEAHQRQRRIPRHDADDDADGLVLRVVEDAGLVGGD